MQTVIYRSVYIDSDEVDEKQRHEDSRHRRDREGLLGKRWKGKPKRKARKLPTTKGGALHEQNKQH
jgi:hypothetical protein